MYTLIVNECLQFVTFTFVFKKFILYFTVITSTLHYKTGLLYFFIKIIYHYCENHKNAHTLCGQNAQFLVLKLKVDVAALAIVEYEITSLVYNCTSTEIDSALISKMVCCWW